MITGGSRDFLAALAGSAAALTGLLFVALSVAPREAANARTPVVRQVRSSAALIAFTNALAVSLYALVPETNIGYPAAALGVIGILFSAAGARSILSSVRTTRQRIRQLGLIALLLAIFGVELVAGIAVVAGPSNDSPLHLIEYALVTSVIVGISRAWELVGDRDTGLFASIAVLIGHAPPPLRSATENDPPDPQ